MNKKLLKITGLAILLFTISTTCIAQLTPIDFETGGYGATWNWTTFENATNPAPQIVANPSTSGINTSSTAIQFTSLQAGQPWAGFESLHGAGIGTFTLDSSNSVVKVMVFKSVISDVGVKFVTPSSASTGELKVANTLTNEWEELTFDFTSLIGHPAMIGIDQIVILPDFDLAGRTSNNISYIDNITMGIPTAPINVTFAVQNTDSTPVFLFGNWDNWSNFPGAPMTLNSTTGNYEASVALAPNTSIEYLFVNGVNTKEVLDSSMACTNGNSQFTNRLTQLGANDTTLCNIWQTCLSCNPLSLNDIQEKNVEILAGNKFVRINTSDFSSFDQLEITTLLGKKIFSAQERILANQNIPIELNSNQLYIIRVRSGDNYFTTKTIIKN